MNEQQFLTKYHEYQTHCATEAILEADKVNLEAEGFWVEAVDQGSLGWCLMLREAAVEARSIIPDPKMSNPSRPNQDEEIKAIPEKPQKPQTPKWEQSPAEIASEIANNFYPVTSTFHADLRRQIIKAIEAEREVTRYYMVQMGRWWDRLGG